MSRGGSFLRRSSRSDSFGRSATEIRAHVGAPDQTFSSGLSRRKCESRHCGSHTSEDSRPMTNDALSSSCRWSSGARSSRGSSDFPPLCPKMPVAPFLAVAAACGTFQHKSRFYRIKPAYFELRAYRRGARSELGSYGWRLRPTHRSSLFTRPQTRKTIRKSIDKYRQSGIIGER